MEQALQAKKICEREAHRAKCFEEEIDKIEKMIDRLSLVYSVRLQKGVNYANMKIRKPPSDN